MKNVFSRDMIQDNWYQCALYQFSYHLLFVNMNEYEVVMFTSPPFEWEERSRVPMYEYR
jgi:hypothetical protein